MAVEGEGDEVEYESDPEDALRPSAMRRREASDDEDGEGSDGVAKPARRDLRAGKGSDGESDGQGGAPAYEDEEEFDAEDDEEELEEEADEELEEEAELEERASEEGGDGEGGDGGAPEEAGALAAVVPESVGDGRRSGDEPVGYQGNNQVEEDDDDEEAEKKENEPFAVPTAGAFYMHDDRFRENGRGRRRRMPGARKLWESKDERAWVHDRFEEMNLQDARHDEERRTSRGRFRGRGNSKSWGADRGYLRGNRSQAYDDSNNQNRAPRSVRGRGPRRYEPPPKNNSEIPATQNKQYTKSQESTYSAGAGRQSSHASNMQPDLVLPRKHVFASSLSSASPPFYPSGSSNKDISVTQKRDAQTGTTRKIVSSPMHMEDNFSKSQSGPLLRGKAIVDFFGHDDREYMDDSIRSVAGKSLPSSQLQSSGSSLSSISPTQSHSRLQAKGVTVTGSMNHQPTTSFSQITRVSAQTQPPLQQRPVQTPVQAALRMSTQQIGQRPSSGTQASSPPQAPSINSSDVGETGSPPGLGKSNTPLVGKLKVSNQAGSGRGSFLYSGAQVIGATGAMGLAHGDQSFSATPALLPVMQFASQHHGGLGVPAVGMALPGYVAQPQLGFGNSEMTWVPVLAGAAGALGASYGSPYITLDSSFYARTSGQTSSSTSSRETSTNKPANTWKSPQGPEIVNDELGQRQNKPRRYSEMNFGQ